jgi:hypothetical protein
MERPLESMNAALGVVWYRGAHGVTLALIKLESPVTFRCPVRQRHQQQRDHHHTLSLLEHGEL